MKKGELKQLISGLIWGIFAFGLTFILKMPIPLMIIVPVGVYFGVYMISKPEMRIGSVKLNEANGEELKRLMEDAYSDLETLKQASKIIDPKIKELSSNLYKSGVAIFEHLQKNPDKIGLARRFINYYLDTAAGLVEKYYNLTSSSVKGQSVIKARDDVVNGLTVLNEAFDKQFERLMQGEIMDISTDVKILEQTYKSEG